MWVNEEVPQVRKMNIREKMKDNQFVGFFVPKELWKQFKIKNINENKKIAEIIVELIKKYISVADIG